jgi:hypothetical protein
MGGSVTVSVGGKNDYFEKTAENHAHSHCLWMAAAAVPAGETHAADRFSPDAVATFQLDAGNLTWGAWVLLLGSSDTPVIAGKLAYDSGIIFVTASERNVPYIIQFGHGTSGAAALAANEISELVYTVLSAASDARPIELKMDRHNSGTKLWARCFCPTQNTGTINFYLGLHEYGHVIA